MRIFFLGDASSDKLTRYRADALVRLGHQVGIADLDAAFARDTRHPVRGSCIAAADIDFAGSGPLVDTTTCSRSLAGPPDLVRVDNWATDWKASGGSAAPLNVPMLAHNVDDPTDG